MFNYYYLGVEVITSKNVNGTKLKTLNLRTGEQKMLTVSTQLAKDNKTRELPGFMNGVEFLG